MDKTDFEKEKWSSLNASKQISVFGWQVKIDKFYVMFSHTLYGGDREQVFF